MISQLRKTHDNLDVYAEPLPSNELLLPPHKWPRHELVAALRSLGDAFARHARKPCVLKFSSWNTLFCDLLAEAFPDPPWILSLRDPEEFVARLYGAFCAAAVRLDAGRDQLVHDETLPCDRRLTYSRVRNCNAWKNCTHDAEQSEAVTWLAEVRHHPSTDGLATRSHTAVIQT